MLPGTPVVAARKQCAGCCAARHEGMEAPGARHRPHAAPAMVHRRGKGGIERSAQQGIT